MKYDISVIIIKYLKEKIIKLIKFSKQKHTHTHKLGHMNRVTKKNELLKKKEKYLS